MIAVIIPYYQNSPGILARALNSIAAQQACPLPVYVIVVDDGSPAPAGPELAASSLVHHSVQVISQPNGGPGAARNTGLDNALPGTRYIAFLDSDDEWTPDHLARAVAALDSGYDFYFSDLYQLEQTTSAFARAGRIQPSNYPELPCLPSGLHAYQGDMLDQIIRGNVIGTPTVVFNFDRFKNERFRTEFSNAGEDYLFWMGLVHKGARIAFSSHPEVRCGKGVNVYAGAGWGSEQHMLRIHNELKYRKTTIQLYALSTAQRAHLRNSMRDLRSAFVSDLFHRIKHRRRLPLKLLAVHFKSDPLSYVYAPINLISLLLKKI